MYSELIKNKIKYFNQLLNKPWKYSTIYKNITIEHLQIDESPYIAIKANGNINNYKILIDQIWNCTTLNDIKKMFPNTIVFEILQNIDDNTRLIYQVNKDSFIDPRESIYLLVRQDNMILSFSIDYDYPSQVKYSVRTNVPISGFLFSATGSSTENECNITYILHAEPGGLIPSFLVNNYIDRHIKSIIDHIK